MDEKQGGARNPKEARLTVRVTDEIENRLEVVADKLGLNKGTTSALCVGVGLRAVEAMLADLPAVQIPQK